MKKSRLQDEKNPLHLSGCSIFNFWACCSEN